MEDYIDRAIRAQLKSLRGLEVDEMREAVRKRTGIGCAGRMPKQSVRNVINDAIDCEARRLGITTMRQRQKADAAKIRKAKKASRKAGKKNNKKYVTKAARSGFYRSEEWIRLRYAALKAAEGRCMICGSSAHEDGIRLMVDHIEAISKAWDKRLDPDNVQVACSLCNWGKLDAAGDFRPKWFTADLVLHHIE